MGGKSTYCMNRFVVYSHIRSFVPADSAKIPLTDRIFTRVGASDNLVRGQSTFMVEMQETAQILHYATKDSLIILDESGAALRHMTESRWRGRFWNIFTSTVGAKTLLQRIIMS